MKSKPKAQMGGTSHLTWLARKINQKSCPVASPSCLPKWQAPFLTLLCFECRPLLQGRQGCRSVGTSRRLWVAYLMIWEPRRDFSSPDHIPVPSHASLSLPNGNPSTTADLRSKDRTMTQVSKWWEASWRYMRGWRPGLVSKLLALQTWDLEFDSQDPNQKVVRHSY